MGQDALEHETDFRSVNDSADEERLGDLLKRERERRGLSHTQVFELTRLRPNFLYALENEDWKRIPDPAFIRGFILTYAKALGLREDVVLGLYAKTVLPACEPPRLPVQPRRPWKNPALFVMLFLACGAVVLYLFTEYPSSDQHPGIRRPVAPASSRPAATLKIPETPRGTEGRVTPSPAQEAADREGPSLIPPSLNGASRGLESQKPASGVPETPTAGLQGSPGESQPLQQAEDSHKVLKAHVRETTWMRITVDDEAPREYIFSPGSRPEWKARGGFDLLIGNAGGVDLDFEGEKLAPLGTPGKVVRLRLPGDFEGRRPRN